MSSQLYRETVNRNSAAYFNHMALAVFLLAVLIVLPQTFLSEEMKRLYVDEGGFIQVLSAAGYLIVVSTLVREMSYEDLLKHWYFLVLPIAMCLRELDFHVHFTTYSITKTSFYVSPNVPLLEKSMAALAFLGVGTSIYFLVKQNFRSFVSGLRRLDATPVAILAAIGCVVFSKVLDGAQSNLQFLGIHVTSTYTSVVIEEVLELGIPIFLSIATFAAFPTRNRPKIRSDAL